jgi:hypothetical protein
MVLSQAGQENWTLFLHGQPGQAPVAQLDGKSYVELEALARLVHGSLGFNGKQVTLTLPASVVNTPTTTPPAGQPANPGFSKEFLRAGIEEMAVIREWRSALVSAVQNGYRVTEDWMAGYQGAASTNLRLASVAASTDSDRNAFQLLSNELDNMKKLSDRFVAANKSMNYTSPDALKGDPSDQQILSCARSLASMAVSGQFVDDGSCH